MAVPYNRLIEEHGLSTEKLKAAFNYESRGDRPKVKKLTDNIRDIVEMGIGRNRRDYRLYKAMDWAFDAPFEQASYTMLRGLMSAEPDQKKVMSTLNSWGLAHLLQDKLGDDGRPCCGADGKTEKIVNLPVFFNVLVPLCMSYLTIRWGKIFNDLNQSPHFKYEPAQATKDNQIRAEIVTQVVERQSKWFGYPADTRQSIFQMLQYGICINFPRESWYREAQEDQNGKEITIREGLRWDMPHPSRTYYDTFHRASSLNTNSGCKYLGNWKLDRYQEVYDNPVFWNKDRITFGASNWFDLGKSDFLSQVYPCNMGFPTASSGAGGVGANDRESRNADNYYSAGQFNTATLVTNHFQEITPKDFGLGDYKYPVWFRFVMGSEDTVLFAEPLSFDRFPTYAYDADFNRDRFRSMTLEIMPFQDHIGNVLSHWILAVKQNLQNPIFFDQDQVPAEFLKELRNLGQKAYAGNLYIPFSGTTNYVQKQNERGAFHQPQLARHNVQELQILMGGIIAMLDRLLLVSPQETGQAASHEQTAEESRIVDRNMSTRVEFTESFVHDGQTAKKRAIYDATMAHADDNIIANISSSLVETEEELKRISTKLGLTLIDGSDYNANDPNRVYTVKAKKSAMALEEFVSSRSDSDRINSAGIADAMAKIFLAVAGNEVLIRAVGPVQLVELLNQIIVTSGLPKEFRLRGKDVDLDAGQEEQASQVAKLLEDFAAKVKDALDQQQQATLAAAAQQTEQIVGAALQQASAQIAQQVTPIVEAAAQGAQVNQAQQQQIDTLNAALKQLTGAIASAAQTATVTQPPPAPMPMESPLAPVSLPV